MVPCCLAAHACFVRGTWILTESPARRRSARDRDSDATRTTRTRNTDGPAPSWRGHNCLVNPNGEAWRNELSEGVRVAVRTGHGSRYPHGLATRLGRPAESRGGGGGRGAAATGAGPGRGVADPCLAGPQARNSTRIQIRSDSEWARYPKAMPAGRPGGAVGIRVCPPVPEPRPLRPRRGSAALTAGPRGPGVTRRRREDSDRPRASRRICDG